jgi:hypothetical protein
MSETKRTIAVLYALALSTCFLPLFTLSPPALGKSEWSALDIFRLLASGPNERWIGSRSIAYLLVGYTLLASGMLLLWLPRYLKAASICTVLSLLLAARALTIDDRHYTISRILKNQAGWHGGTIFLTSEAFVLPALLVFLLFVLSIEWKLRPPPREL